VLGDLRSKQTIYMLNRKLDVIVLSSAGQREICEMHFIQNKAPPHSVLAVPGWTDSHFTCRWTGRGEPSDWTPQSTGLNPCNLFCVVEPGRRSTDQNQNTRRTGTSSKYFCCCLLWLLERKCRVCVLQGAELCKNAGVHVEVCYHMTVYGPHNGARTVTTL